MHKTYILTIQRNIDRAYKILPRISNSETVIGLDAKKADDKSAISHVRSKTNSEIILSDGEAACTLGHKTILEKFLKSNDSYCVVLEDDVEATSLSQYLEQDLPEIFDGGDQALIFVLGGQEGIGRCRLWIDWKTPFRILRSGTVYDLTASSAFVFRTCCYGINRHAAKQLIEFYENNLIGADDYFRIVNNTCIKLLLKKEGYYSHPIGGPSELEYGRIGFTQGRLTSSIFYKIFGVVLIYIYNSIEPIKPSFYSWVLRRILFKKSVDFS